MHLIQPLKNEFCFDLPRFSKYPATSINSYFYKMTLYEDNWNFHKLRGKSRFQLLLRLPQRSLKRLRSSQLLSDLHILLVIVSFVSRLNEIRQISPAKKMQISKWYSNKNFSILSRNRVLYYTRFVTIIWQEKGGSTVA